MMPEGAPAGSNPEKSWAKLMAIGVNPDLEAGELVEFYRGEVERLAYINEQLTRALRESEAELREERLQEDNVALSEEVDRALMFEEIVGASPALMAVRSRARKVAGSDSTVLIGGETGTGKDIVARAIHRRSRRASRAFVALNCAAIPRDLIASELGAAMRLGIPRSTLESKIRG
jgi:transcriptional regulator with GAF, ATPase, and Fis domain